MAAASAPERSRTAASSNTGWLTAELLSGSISGALTRFVVAPLDVVKIRLQLQPPRLASAAEGTWYKSSYSYKSVDEAVRTIWGQEGVVGFWRGNLMAEALYASFLAVQFATYHGSQLAISQLAGISAEEAISGGNRAKEAMVTMAAGGIAGFAATTVSYPFDMFRTRFAAQSHPPVYVSFADALKKAYGSSGFRGFYHGFGAALFTVIPYTGIQFVAYRSIKAIFPVELRDVSVVYLVSGAMAGIISKMCVLPLDILKKRSQVQVMNFHASQGADASGGPFAFQRLTTLDIARNMYRIEGPRAFFKGAVPSAMKTALATALGFFLYEKVAKVVNKQLKHKTLAL